MRLLVMDAQTTHTYNSLVCPATYIPYSNKKKQLYTVYFTVASAQLCLRVRVAGMLSGQ